MSLLYECINGIIQGGILDGDESFRERDEIASLCVGKLRGMIVTDADPNRKYSHIISSSAETNTRLQSSTLLFLHSIEL